MDARKLKRIAAAIGFPLFYLYTNHMMKREPLKVISEEETRALLAMGHSISRFGDGEINIAMGKCGINFQELDDALQVRLREILRLDVNSCPGFLIGFTPTMSTYQGYTLHQKFFWTTFNTAKRPWLMNNIFDRGQGQSYADPLFARMYGFKNYTHEMFWSKYESLQSIWGKKNVLIVEGTTSKLGVNNDLLYSANTIERILIPARHAYRYYDPIFRAVLERPRPDIILLVAGPLATVMAYDLYREGYHAIDLGQFNAGYVEAVDSYGGFRNPVLTEASYRSQIVASIDGTRA